MPLLLLYDLFFVFVSPLLLERWVQTPLPLPMPMATAMPMPTPTPITHVAPEGKIKPLSMLPVDEDTAGLTAGAAALSQTGANPTAGDADANANTAAAAADNDVPMDVLAITGQPNTLMRAPPL